MHLGQAVSATTALILLPLFALAHFRRNPFRPTKEQRDSLLSDEIDDWEEAVEGKKCLQKWIMRARTQFGYISECTAANREAVRIWLRNAMREEHVRIKDMFEMLPFASLGPFIPWRGMCQSHALLHDREVRRRKRFAPAGK